MRRSTRLRCITASTQSSSILNCGLLLLSLLPCLQSALAKERREVQQQQQRTLLEAIPKDLSRPWEDPMPEEGERHLAAVSDQGLSTQQNLTLYTSY